MKIQFKRNDRCYIFFTKWAYISKDFGKDEYSIRLVNGVNNFPIYRSKKKPPTINLRFLSTLGILHHLCCMALNITLLVVLWLPGRGFHVAGHLLTAIGHFLMMNPSTARRTLMDALSVFVTGKDIFR